MKPEIKSFDLVLPDETATGRLATEIAAILQPDDLITLSGDIGAGKTAFTRAVIRAKAQDPSLDVPSPTYTLIQHYDLKPLSIVHADLYRLQSAAELEQLGWEEAQNGAAVIVEWPQRVKELSLTPDRLEIEFLNAPDLGNNFRRITLNGHGIWAKRLSRFMHVRAFLITAGWDKAIRAPMQGDASSRRYERLTMTGQQAIIMDAPRRPDGPVIRDGKPYSRIAHLAEDVTPFIAMTNGLRSTGLSAPRIIAADRIQGFVLLEDLGATGIIDPITQAPILERYVAAVDVLTILHDRALSNRISLSPQETYTLPDYDLSALLIETELLIDWYLPHTGEAALSPAKKQEYLKLWQTYLELIIAAKPTWVLRDYHSPNLLWLEKRENHARIGLLDYQDAVMGHPAYDVVSLLQDARVTIPEDLELALLGHYVKARSRIGKYDVSEFTKAYAILGAQRASKILGIFARLKHRDGKAQYLQHMPRIWTYLQRALAHPELQDLANWYGVNIPAPGRAQPKAFSAKVDTGFATENA